MAQTMTENVGSTLQKGLSEWWSEETEYVFQRIERWAAFARGYNRLRSERLSRGRLTMQEEQEPRWSISANKLIIDDSSWSPRFHTLKRSRRKSRPEETKINCCGTFNYQSNSNLDSACLEAYRYDHSIYFKTIGDIRNSKKAQEGKIDGGEDRISIGSEELVEWDAKAATKAAEARITEEEASSGKRGSLDSPDGPPRDFDCNDPSTWPIVDLSKLELDEPEEDGPLEAPWPVLDTSKLGLATTEGSGRHESSRDELNNEIGRKDGTWTSDPAGLEEEARQEVENNNYVKCVECTGSLTLESPRSSRTEVKAGCREEQKGQEGLKRFLSCRRSRRTSRPKQEPIIGDRNVVWPGVLLNYTKNVDPGASPHRQRALRYK